MNENSIDLDLGVTVQIPIGAVHRLSNRSSQDLHIIEVQLGELLLESDMERLEDDYNRITETIF